MLACRSARRDLARKLDERPVAPSTRPSDENRHIAIAASFLIRQVGEKNARELLLSGRLLKAEEALQLGLVTQVVPAEELMQTAQALAQTLLMNSPQAMQAVKRLLAKHARRRLDEEIEDAIQVNAQQRSTEDFKEGVEAFKQHRRPDWPSMRAKV